MWQEKTLYIILLKARNCQGVISRDGDKYVVQLEQTKRWFDISSFTPEPGFLLIAEELNYVLKITDVKYLEKRPKHVVFTAIPVLSAQALPVPSDVVSLLPVYDSQPYSYHAFERLLIVHNSRTIGDFTS